MQFSVGPCLRARVSPTGHFLDLLPSAPPFLPAAEGDVPCPRARVTFGRSPKSDQKRCLKPQVSRLPARLGCAENRGRVPRENQDSADRRTTNRVRSSCRCRSCVPRGGALVYRRGRLSNRALAAGKCRCGPSGCGRERSERRQRRMQRGERVAAVKISSVRRQEAQKFWAPQQCTFYK